MWQRGYQTLKNGNRETRRDSSEDNERGMEEPHMGNNRYEENPYPL
jgi:hypothetical protein